MSTSNLTLGSLFDGIGGFPCAASFYGIRPLWASEIVPECVSVTRRHFPDMTHVGDITQLHGGRLPPVDIITFGSPCQGLSLAGRRRGLADERSGLFIEAIRIIEEMRKETHGKYPKFAIFENVPGALSSSGRRDFKAVLEAFTNSEVPMPGSGRWANAGMVRGRGTDFAWIVYDAQYFATAQRRKRLFLVADFRGERAGEILFVPKSLRGYFEAGGTPQQGLAAFAESGADATGTAIEMLNDQGRDSISILEAYSIGAYYSKGMLSDNPSVGFSATETSRTLDQNCGNPGCQQGGIAVVSAVDCRNLREIEELSGTLQAKSASGGYSLNYQNPVRVGFNVRRLTPLEAERLMGFPDYWTAHGYDGRPISDSKRYQMLGNSIAVPCVAYIMQGIRQVL